MERAYVDARTARLVAGADRRDADPLDAGRQPGAARPACGQPVLPARRAGALPTASPGTTHREEVADLMIDTVDRFAPNFKASVLGRQILTPLDLERTFGLHRRRHHPRRAELDQLFSARPVLGHGDYRGPIAGALHVRRGHPSRRRRHRRAGPQRGARDPDRLSPPALASGRLSVARARHERNSSDRSLEKTVASGTLGAS